MARVTVETVDHVARLANLSLSQDERTTFARQLEEILEYAEAIQALDTDKVAPMSHPAAAAAFREDVATECLPQNSALAPAPDAESGLFRVPRVIGG